MSDSEELRQMILNFRVSELQVLLGFAGKNKSGKKQELQSRALDLLRIRSTPVQMKIRELHNYVLSDRRRYPVGGSGSDLPSGGNASSERSDHPATRTYSNVDPVSPIKSSQYSMPSAPRPPIMSPHHSVHPGSSIDYGGSSSKHIASSNAATGYPVHPDVKFKALPFYDILAELLKPTSLMPSCGTRFQESTFVFHLTPQQAHDIAMSRDVRPGVKNEHTVQVQLRFCLLETSCEQEDNFPPSICVKVNSKICSLPNPIPTNKPGVEPKRPSRPVNITSMCRLCPTVTNYIGVSWASEYGRAYAVGVYLVRRLSSGILLQRLKGTGVRNPDHTRAMIKEKLQQDPDSEIATTSLRGSLTCPLGKMRMQVPCRAVTCTHLQCFDANLYLQMNEKKPTWICPVCDKIAPFNNLLIDGLFMEITTKAPGDCSEVQFHDDGSWTPLLSKKESHPVSPAVLPTSPRLSSPEKKRPKFEVIDLTFDSSSEDESDSRVPPSPRAASGSSAAPSGGIPLISLPSPSSPSSSSTSSNSSSSSSTSSNSSYPSIITSQFNAQTTVTTTTSAGSATCASYGNPLLPTTLASCISPPRSSPSVGISQSSGMTAVSSAGVTATSSVQSSSLQNNPFCPSMPIIEPNTPSYYPPVSSPFHEYLTSDPLYNYPNFNIYSLLQNSESDRQIPSYSTVPSSRKPSNTSPDVISLD